MKWQLTLLVFVFFQFTTDTIVLAQDSSGLYEKNVEPDLSIKQRTQKQPTKSATTNWRENIITEVPNAICANDTWHRECFNIRESQCLSATAKVVNDCIDYVQAQQKKNATPTTTSMSIAELQEQTRLCVITLYERRYARRFKYIESCKDRTKW